MRSGRLPLIGWGVFLLAGSGAAFAAPGWQLGCAGLAIGLFGLPHGASDLAIVPPARRASFLAAYLGCIAATLALWRADAALGLALLLVLSALHFALDGTVSEGRQADWAMGGFLVGGPVLFHRAAVAGLFVDAAGDVNAAAILVIILQAIGLLATTMLIQRIVAARRDRQPWLWIVAVAATLAAPPLVGFAIGFVLLHAREQTVARQRAIGCATMAGYLLAVTPLMVAAAAVLVIVATVATGGRVGDAGFLFAAIAALATPHMLVTPFWRRDEHPRSLDRPAFGVARRLGNMP